TYGTDFQQQLVLKTQLIFPMLRTIPNDTRGSLQWLVDKQEDSLVYINNKPVNETLTSVSLNGILNITSSVMKGVELTHNVFPSVEKAALIDACRISNNGTATITVHIPGLYISDTTPAEKGAYGS